MSLYAFAVLSGMLLIALYNFKPTSVIYLKRLSLPIICSVFCTFTDYFFKHSSCFGIEGIKFMAKCCFPIALSILCSFRNSLSHRIYKIIGYFA